MLKSRTPCEAAYDLAIQDSAAVAETAKTLRVWLPTNPDGTGESEHTSVHGQEIAGIIRALKARAE